MCLVKFVLERSVQPFIALVYCFLCLWCILDYWFWVISRFYVVDKDCFQIIRWFTNYTVSLTLSPLLNRFLPILPAKLIITSLRCLRYVRPNLRTTINKLRSRYILKHILASCWPTLPYQRLAQLAFTSWKHWLIAPYYLLVYPLLLIQDVLCLQRTILLLLNWVLSNDFLCCVTLNNSWICVAMRCALVVQGYISVLGRR